MPPEDRVPNRLHFVWFGRHLPGFAAIAAHSAQAHNPQARVVLWHDSQLEPCQRTERLARLGVQRQVLDFDELLGQARDRAGSESRQALDTLGRIWRTLDAPAARSNVVRLLILFAQGGIYLDTDTLTLRPLDRLREQPAFCGLEHLLWSKRRLDKRRLYFWTLGPALSELRRLSSWHPGGHALNRGLLRFYDQAANNAVLGFSPQHPFLERAFQRIASLPRAEWTRRFRLGTHLLQELLASRPPGELEVHEYPPDHFYPLGPVISAHYFRRRRDAAQATRELVPATTHVIHWYASVANLSRLDESYISRHRSESVYTHLCAPFLE